ncbi:tRNA (adenosine(37)-N6)-threonylcarbamoyltransferase complex transferase subunit TsaD [Candidatus Parcubacteria bacterium]|nr:MAG: tRNA (adenosine(37)-N6)-threonylcarbamoyltransferase complex transferase subunit TsaD [Candidatus Parcubacteria bacterium]
MKILGIETSADDSGIALIEAQGSFGNDFKMEILAQGVSSQTIHAGYGGIFPAMAKKEHAKNLPILFAKLFGEEPPKVDTIAVTVGPGLEPCLWTGITFAKELAAKWSVPIVPVNHMEGHILVSMVNNGTFLPCEFPALALLISGGHTDLILTKEFQLYEYLGRTRDDAVGEAFDKVARMMNLPYPGGPHISKLAEEARVRNQESGIKLPRPMLNENNYDFSFSGLKTAVLRLVEAEKDPSDDFKRQIARAFEDAAADVLVQKTFRAAEEHGVKTILVGGGVSANAFIKKELRARAEKEGVGLLISPLEFTGDNAVMIALAGYFRALKKGFANPKELVANGMLRLDILS